MNFLPHQIPGTAQACRHPLIRGHYCVKVERKDGKGMDCVNGLDGVSAASFYSLAEATKAAADMNAAVTPPTYDELLAALRHIHDVTAALCGDAKTPTFDKVNACAAALLGRLPA